MFYHQLDPNPTGAGLQATSRKRQAASYARFKLQAAQGASGKLQAPSSKHQAASHERQAL
jgi:hypothetical protein